MTLCNYALFILQICKMLHLFKQGFLFRRRGRCKHVLKLTSEFTFVNLATEIRKKRLSLCLKIIQKVSFLGSLLSIFVPNTTDQPFGHFSVKIPMRLFDGFQTL